VVSTYLPDLEETGGFVYLARTPDEFIAHIEKAISEDSLVQAGQRLKYSFNYTWANRAEFVSQELERILECGKK
ncbi:MAG: hypothetical protein V1650_01055, partial [Candidatus Omnitrophota bacterium]